MFVEKLKRFRKPKKSDSHYLVLPQHNIAYARIPKAANSSIKYTLHDFLFGPQEKLKKINHDSFWRNHESGLANIVDARHLVKSNPDCFVFTFVRNPFCRLASCYYEKIAMKQEKGLAPWLTKHGFDLKMTFADFVLRACDIEDKKANIHIRSQSAMLHSKDSVSCNFVGRVETIDQDWVALIEACQDKTGHVLPKIRTKNVSKARPSTRDMYDANLVQLVRKRYAEDFMHFYPDMAEPM